MQRRKEKNGVIGGERIYLRRLVLADVTPRYCRWLNDPEVNRYLESRFRRHTLRSLERDVQGMLADARNVFFAIVLRDGDRHIGNIKLGPILKEHRLADMGILIGEKDCWGQGYAAEAIQLLVGYSFQVLRLHKVTAGCYASNQGSLKAFLKAGFVQEGLRRKHCYCQGKYVDDILLGKINARSGALKKATRWQR